ncbi:MAG: class I SAM-dependent methyltransferase family protein [Nanoarchaeota archaeon]|nr:class I SAM-dependent methyltransferase family protein [Nanoarchaeota archaeon]MBU1622685.1 class I SAM-dependent methyltransferase family protein [Nanoarchaeota archaeon]
MYAAFTELKHAQKVKQFLAKKNVLHPDYLPLKILDHLYFPLTKRIKVPSAKVALTKLKFPLKDSSITIEKLLEKKLTKHQLKFIPRAQEIVGQIMILEIPKELLKKEKIIAEAYLKLNKNITTVVKKNKIHSGTYRLRKLKILAGKRTKETIHYENKVRIKLHLEKTYFSARSGNERLRIAQQVKKGEQVLVLFSGAAPFPLVIAKNSSAKSILGIEINPLAHQYALENVKLNKMENKIIIHQGDVRAILPKIRKKFSRIAMPLPKSGEQFLDLALKKSKRGTIIHLYDFLHENEFKLQAKKIREICKHNKKPVRILRTVKCGQFSPGVFRVCFDLKVL